MLIFQKNAEVRGEDLKIPTHSDKWVGMGRGKKLRTSYMDSSDELNEAHWHKNMNWDMSSFRGFLINEAITSKNQITLVLLKNINIWLSYSPNMACMPIFGHTFFGHDSAIFGTIVLKMLRELKRLLSIDWWMVMALWCLIFDLLCHFWPENGRGCQAHPLWFGASTHDQNVGQLLSRNRVFEIFKPEPLPN